MPCLRIKIANRTNRTYRFRRDQVRVVSQEGQRLSALGAAELVGTEASPGSHLDQQLAAETTIEPDGTLEVCSTSGDDLPASQCRFD